MFFTFPRERWPVSREFVRTKLPENEIRHRDLNFFTAAVVRTNFCSAGGGKLSVPSPFSTVDEISHYSNSITKVQIILARVLRGWKSGSIVLKINNPIALSLIAKELTKEEIEHARDLLLIHAMPATVEAFNQGKLASLLPVRDGRLIVTTGRLGGNSLSRLLGVNCLLMPNTRIAHLYMVLAHEYDGQNKLAVENHRAAVGTLARSRNYVWVLKGKQLAKQVVSQCTACRIERKKLETQQMGILREEGPCYCLPSLDSG